MGTDAPRQQLATFLAKYSPALAKQGRDALRAMQGLVPGAVRLVYDNYNFAGHQVGFREATTAAPRAP